MRRASGYRFLADTIIPLDPTNSQVAARLVPPLGQWRRVDPARQALMKQELQRILDAPGLSKGTFEMAITEHRLDAAYGDKLAPRRP